MTIYPEPDESRNHALNLNERKREMFIQLNCDDSRNLEGQPAKAELQLRKFWQTDGSLDTAPCPPHYIGHARVTARGGRSPSEACACVHAHGAPSNFRHSTKAHARGVARPTPLDGGAERGRTPLRGVAEATPFEGEAPPRRGELERRSRGVDLPTAPSRGVLPPTAVATGSLPKPIM